MGLIIDMQPLAVSPPSFGRRLERARGWGLYLAGSRLSFEENALQVQSAAGGRTVGGVFGMPLRPDWA